mmetsp:Transcript_45696/g.93491  ORF Transcript_45696/g.93491 Transcript_45696/m.93491 type:complete len:240 (-) Transcript_45696:653-1372(-)
MLTLEANCPFPARRALPSALGELEAAWGARNTAAGGLPVAHTEEARVARGRGAWLTGTLAVAAAVHAVEAGRCTRQAGRAGLWPPGGLEAPVRTRQALASGGCAAQRTKTAGGHAAQRRQGCGPAKGLNDSGPHRTQLPGLEPPQPCRSKPAGQLRLSHARQRPPASAASLKLPAAHARSNSMPSRRCYSTGGAHLQSSLAASKRIWATRSPQQESLLSSRWCCASSMDKFPCNPTSTC